MTSEEALQRFIEAITFARDGQPERPPIRTAAQKRRLHERAEKSLAEGGI